MNEESILQEFDRLESKLNGLIEKCDALKAENLQLEARNNALEEELLEKTDNQNRFMEERNMVRSRIDGLLARVNESIGIGQEGYTD